MGSGKSTWQVLNNPVNQVGAGGLPLHTSEQISDAPRRRILTLTLGNQLIAEGQGRESHQNSFKH